MHDLRPLVGPQARDLSEALAALIDGVYLRAVVTEAGADRAAAVQLVLGFLNSELAKGDRG